MRRIQAHGTATQFVLVPRMPEIKHEHFQCPESRFMSVSAVARTRCRATKLSGDMGFFPPATSSDLPGPGLGLPEAQTQESRDPVTASLVAARLRASSPRSKQGRGALPARART
eukprot:3557853-Rhodomonas_salina.3